MTKQDEIAAFLNEYVSLPRVTNRHGWTAGHSWASYPPHAAGPTADQLADELLAVAEFRALQLGTWLGTADGQIIAEAIEMVAPPFYRQDIGLLFDALRLAASLQEHEGRRVAGRFALGVLASAGLFTVLAVSGRSTRHAALRQAQDSLIG